MRVRGFSGQNQTVLRAAIRANLISIHIFIEFHKNHSIV